MTYKKSEKSWGNEVYYLLLFSIIIFADRIFKASISGCNFLFCISYSENTGAAFGILKNHALLLIAVAIILLIAVFYFFTKAKSNLLKTALALVAAGTAGNLIDRISYGYVIDIIKINAFSFNLFNIADLSNTIGAILLVIFLLKKNN